MQNRCYQVPQRVRNIGGLRERIADLLDLLIGLLDVLRFKGRPPEGQSVHDYPKAPGIDFVAVPPGLEYLGCYVVGRAADGLPLIAWELDAGGQPEIAQLEGHGLSQKEVAELQIPVDDLVIVEIDEGVKQLQQIQLDLGLSEALLALEQIVEGVVSAQLQQDVHVQVVLERVSELHDVRVVQAFVDLDLADELSYTTTTFCLERGFVRLHFWMILTANSSLESCLRNS